MKEVTSLKEETTNKTKALDSEREKRKSYESTLSEQTEKERLKKEERLRKEGKTEQLLEEYQSKVKLLNDKLSDLEPKVNEYESFKANQKSKIVTELEELKKNINPSILEGYSDVISGLGEEHQMAFLRRISEDVKTPDFGNKPESK
jgi:chromosome segregation ATPase